MTRCFLLACLLTGPAAAQAPLKVGDPLPDFVLPHVANAPAGTFAPAEAAGKVLVLEFWSTTCSPCVPALRRLAALQQQRAAELQVVGISTDSQARLTKFLAKYPLPGVPLASAPDPQQDINRLFPHRIVSHTVVVDRNRRVVAITTPGQLTEPVLGEILAGRPVRLKPKQDVMSDDPLSFFAVDSTTRYGVSVRPFVQGLSGQTRFARKGPFAGRRLTAINASPQNLFQEAYEVSRFRVQNMLPDSLRQYDDLNLVCFDLIVPPGQEASLRPIMRDALRLYLPVQTAWVPTTRPVLVLRCRPGGPVLPASVKPAQFSFGGGEFAMQGSPLAKLGGYLENELQLPVVDETGLAGRYDAAFAVQPESLRASLDAALARLGLELVAASREIQMLRLTASTPPR